MAHSKCQFVFLFVWSVVWCVAGDVYVMVSDYNLEASH